MPLLYTDAEYFMVDSLPPKREVVKEDIMHDKWSGYNGYLDLSIDLVNQKIEFGESSKEEIFKSPLHIGTGDIELYSKGGYYQPFLRAGNNLFVSGSSIKGVVRSYSEALSSSCEGNQCNGDRLCPACRLFGCVSKGSGRRNDFNYQGRISISDVYFAENIKTSILKIPLRWGGKNREGRRFYWHCDYRAYEDINNVETEKLEIVLPPAGVTTRLYFENVSKQELGLLFLAMGLDPKHRFPLKMGGGKNRGLGSVWFMIKNQLVIGKSEHYYSTYDPEPQASKEDFLKTCLDQHLKTFNEEDRIIIDNNLKAFNLNHAYRTRSKAKQEFEQQVERNKDKYSRR